ncbi:MAG TPA: hypothetical protein VGN72_22410 [Tepidisphaeraceae bacterium]|jgi:hypothetical protein|nr:hypothetical protein [Tepidisphaeraceae bacterium]
MFSTRNQVIRTTTLRQLTLALVAGGAMAGGCQKVLPPRTQPVVLMEEQRPLPVDQATQLRDWEKSTLYYPNGSVVAGSTRFPLAPRAQAGQYERNAVEPVLFLANIVALPITYFYKPPFESYTWNGEITPASFTVQPAYPYEGDPSAPTAPLPGDGVGGANLDGTNVGPVPPAQAPVPSVSEPVRRPSGEQPPLPTENQGVTEVPGRPADANPQPVAPRPTPRSTPRPSGGSRGGAIVP